MSVVEFFLEDIYGKAPESFLSGTTTGGHKQDRTRQT